MAETLEIVLTLGRVAIFSLLGASPQNPFRLIFGSWVAQTETLFLQGRLRQHDTVAQCRPWTAWVHPGACNPQCRVPAGSGHNTQATTTGRVMVHAPTRTMPRCAHAPLFAAQVTRHPLYNRAPWATCCKGHHQHVTCHKSTGYRWSFVPHKWLACGLHNCQHAKVTTPTRTMPRRYRLRNYHHPEVVGHSRVTPH